MTAKTAKTARKLTIAEWLKKSGKTQVWLAEELNVSKQFIHRVINGHAPCPPDTAYIIARMSEGEVSFEELIVSPELLEAPDPLAYRRAVMA